MLSGPSVDDWGVVGHDWAVKRLKRAIAQGGLAQSHLFVGPAHIGKATLALATARALLGHDARTTALVDKRKHPDLSYIEPEMGGGSIKIDGLRALLHTLSLAPVESRYRVAIIDGAHLMSDGGKNAILKTLEEPNPSVVMILTAPNVDSVLPTISSRCQVLNLRSAPVQQVTADLVRRGVDQKQAAFIARLARGRMGWALNAVNDADVLTARAENLTDLETVLGANRTQRFAYAEKLARRDGAHIQAVLEDWLLLWRDVTRAGTEALNDDQHALIQTLTATVTRAQSAEIMRAISGTIRNLDSNVNARLALDVLLMRLPVVSGSAPASAA